MSRKIYSNTNHYIMGTTLKEDRLPEANNMALHVCKDEATIIKNRNKFVQTIDCELGQIVCAFQTHSDRFYKVTAADCGKGALSNDTAIQNVDALYTYESDILLTTFHADCVPVLIYHKENGLIGAIHSGWQGTVKEITYKLLTHLIKEENCSEEGFIIHIGRALSQDKFEVDEDVYEQFAQYKYANQYMYLNEKTNKYHINNQQVVKEQCVRAGISPNQIVIDETCTYQDENSFSYRENRQCGRHMSFVIKK